MSVVDNRVVQLLFDNQQFESGVKTSQKSLSNLSSMLDKFSGTSVASGAITELAEKFNRLGIVGVTAIQNITNKITDSLTGAIKSLSLDQVTAGFSKYGEKVNSVATIMSATTSTWREDANSINIANELIGNGFDQKVTAPLIDMFDTWNEGGKITQKQMDALGLSAEQFDKAMNTIANAGKYEGSQMEYINDQLNRLNWFTDETSYNFTDMTSNIGKFTAQGQSLSTSVRAMEGIATWAAASGQNAQSASRAMYNMSQALGVGAVKLMDWKSIENANMATLEFKQTAMDTAVELGTLRKEGEKYISVASGDEVTTANFSQSLKDAWFSSDVLIQTLDKYGGFADEIGKVTEAFSDQGVSTTDLLHGIDAILDADGKIDPNNSNYLQWLDDMGLDAKAITPELERLASAEYETGRKAFKAAQEARTFADAMDAIKDGVSTAWMNLFETVFGNYEEAKKIWTDLANSGYSIFAEPVNLLANLLDRLDASSAIENAIKMVGDLGNAVDDYLDAHGEEMLSAFENMFNNIKWVFQILKNSIKTFITPIKEAFRDIFPKQSWEDIANTVAKVSLWFANLFKNIRLGEGTAAKLRTTFQGVFSVFGILKDIISAVFRVIGEFVPSLKSVGSGFLDATSNIGEFIVKLRETLQENDTFYKAIKKVADFIGPVFKKVIDIVGKVTDAFINLFSRKDDAEGFSTAATIGFSGFTTIIEKLSSVLEKVKGVFEKVWGFIKDTAASIKEFISNIDFSKINFKDMLGTGLGVGAGIGIISAFKSMKEFFENGGIGQGLLDTLEGIGKKIGGILDSIKGALQGFTNDLNASAILKIAGALLILAVALFAFTLLANLDGVVEGLALMTGVLAEMIGAIAVMDKIKGKVTAVASALLILSVSMLILAGAIAAFALVAKMDTLGEGLAAFSLVLIEVVAALAVLGEIKAKVLIAAVAMAVLATSMLLLAAALAAFAAVAMMPSFGPGLAAFAGTLILVVAALVVLGEVKAKVIIAAAAMMVLSAAMIVLAGALAAFAAVAMMDTFTTGLGVMILMLVLVVGALTALSAMSAKVIVAAVAMLILSAAMVVLAGALAAFAAVAMMDTFGAGMLAMIGMLAALTIALIALGAAGPVVIAGAAALLIAAVAIGVLAAALIVGSVAIMVFAAALYVLGAAITGIASMIVSLIFDTIDRAAATLVIVADSIGQAVDALFSGIGSGIEALGSGIGGAIDAIGTGIAQVIEELIASIGEGIGRGLESIGEGITAIGDGISSIGDGITAVGTGVTDFGNGMKNLKGVPWVEIAAGLGLVISPLKDLSKINLSGIQASVEEIANAISAIMTTVAEMREVGEAFGNNLADGILSTGPRVSGVARSVSLSGASAIRGTRSSWVSSGIYIVSGLIEGMQQKLNDAYAMAWMIGRTMVDGVNDGAGVDSPSWKTRESGKWLVEGLILGINENSDRAVASVRDMALETVGTASEILANAIENDYSNPVIRPTLDLSNVAAGASQISSMFGQQTVGVNGAGANGATLASGVTYNYTQNNYSPKALNRIEIYRQTKNQINSSNVLASV